MVELSPLRGPRTAGSALDVANVGGGTIAAGDRARIETSLDRVLAWVQAHGYRGYEPADGNSSRLFPLTNGSVMAMRLLQQLVLRAPINIRPLVGVLPHESPIARGYMASGYLLMTRITGREHARREGESCLEWLMANRAAGSEFCWGDPYEYATRAGRRPKGEPLLIWSALIGQVFLDAFETWHDQRYLRVAESTGRWILGLPVERTETGSCLSYVAFRQSSIHNANAMGAAFLARLGALTDSRHAIEAAHQAMTYTCARQRPDGAWFYGEEAKYHWIDNFHTGYNLSAIRTYRSALLDPRFDAQLSNGMRFFTSHFFEPDGRPKYFHDDIYPIDIQCAAQAIETFVAFAHDDPQYLVRALAVARWTIENMQAADGHFYYRDLRWTMVKTPMMHWGQATMVKALATLLLALAVHHA